MKLSGILSVWTYGLGKTFAQKIRRSHVVAFDVESL